MGPVYIIIILDSYGHDKESYSNFEGFSWNIRQI